MLIPCFNPVSDHYTGSIRARAELVLYLDYECRHSSLMQLTINDLAGALGNELKIVIRHFPLQDLHPFALPAAVAAEAAGKQGRFWPMHQKLLDIQSHLNPASIRGIAKEIGLDEDLFEQDLVCRALMEKVIADMTDGRRSGVAATPTIFLNRQRYEGFDDFSSLFKAATESLMYTSALQEETSFKKTLYAPIRKLLFSRTGSA